MSRYPGFDGQAVTDYLLRQGPKRSAWSEKEFQSEVIKLASRLGWMFYHTWSSLHSVAGFPDLALVRFNRFILAELKSETGKVTKEQQKWLDMLSLTPVEQYLWRPSDLDEIVRVLK